MQWPFGKITSHRGRPHGVAARRPRSTLVRALSLAAAAALLTLASPVSAATASPGKVEFIRNATTSFDSFLTGSTSAQQAWMGANYSRMRGYEPYFNRALGWAPPSEFYEDLYALYRDRAADQAVIADHPAWVLRDDDNRKLYIPSGCSGGSCPQFAADVGNPAFRSFWINRIRSNFDLGYEGVFIDDVNLLMRVSNGNGVTARPIDPRTGSPMTDTHWKRYVAEFVEEIDAALPNAHIVHNSGQWWASHSDPHVQREVAAADAIELERGFNDGGIVAGTGTYGYETFLSHIDWLHNRGASITLEPYDLNRTSAEYELANYLLVKRAGDAISTDYRANPDNFWSGWATDLGTPAGARYDWKSLKRRDFSDGMSLVNGPGATQRRVDLPSGRTWTNLGGETVTSVTLSARQGAVLRAESAEEPPVGEEPPASGEEPTVTLRPSRKRIERGRTLRLAGRAPTAAEIEILMKRHGHWRTVDGSVPVRSDNTYKLRTRARSRGVHRYRAQAAGLDRSRIVRVRVKR